LKGTISHSTGGAQFIWYALSSKGTGEHRVLLRFTPKASRWVADESKRPSSKAGFSKTEGPHCEFHTATRPSRPWAFSNTALTSNGGTRIAPENRFGSIPGNAEEI
jgi:hypothetical protein